ncbi:unnamed protein product [Parnassius apollo]|uniref:(apollo) hypothetical protein n=1 Tax=Parnassius apollo TaxID=110799 RepID=A0A8S3X8S5_PARAO|nr:unnamed protein product [Parnassius apollo]
MYEQCRTEVQEVINKEVETICITTDNWTSARNDSFMVVTGHFINKNFDLESIVLDCEVISGPSNSENTASQLKSITDSWGISAKINLAVSDNAAYIKKAISQELGWKHFGCAAHTINLIVQEATEKSVPIKSVIERVKLVVAYFKRSTKATQKLDEFQKQNGATQPKRLLQEVPTRWNSKFYMLERIVEIQDAVKSSIAILSVTSLPNLMPEDWLLCNEICKALKCFEEASNYLSIKRVLNDILSSDSSGYHYLPITYDFVRALLDLTHSRFENIENNNTIGVATFLDPRFKLQPFTSSKQATLRENIIKLVAQEINREGPCENIEVSKSSLDPTSIFYDWDARGLYRNQLCHQLHEQ